MNVNKKIINHFYKGNKLMQGRIKGNLPIDKPVIIKKFDFKVNSRNETYSVFILEDDDVYFYFGGQVITDKLKQIVELLSEEELIELIKTGLPCMFINKKSKNNRIYIDMQLL